MSILEALERDIARRCKLDPPPVDWEFELYRLIEKGFHTYFKYKREGMKREDMTALQRAGLDLSKSEAYQAWKQRNS